MIRLAFFFSALSLAAVMDIRTRTIPDWLVVLVALTSVLPPGTPNFLGVLAGLPLLLAGITIGGIGGGDVKLMGACGLILGASQALTGLFLALCLLVLWHAAGNMGRKKNRKKQKEEKESIRCQVFISRESLRKRHMRQEMEKYRKIQINAKMVSWKEEEKT